MWITVWVLLMGVGVVVSEGVGVGCGFGCRCWCLFWGSVGIDMGRWLDVGEGVGESNICRFLARHSTLIG